jgi:multiple sugar transport system substrate-binding protein
MSSYKQRLPAVSRRQFLQYLGMAVGASALAACAPVASPGVAESTGEQASADPGMQGEITMLAFPLTQDDVTMFRPMQDAFQAENPGVTVNVQIDPWDGRENKMIAALAAGNPPDCVYLNPDFYPRFVNSDVLVALDEYLDDGAMDDFLPGPIAAVTYDGNTYGMPILTSAYTQAYNKRILEEAGVTELPTTWESFRAAVEAVHDPAAGVWGAMLALNRPSTVTTFVPFLRMAGGEQFTADGSDVAFDGPEGEEALDYLVSFYRDGLVQESNINGGGLPFSSGMIGFMIQSENRAVKIAMDDNPDLEIGVVPALEYREKSNFGTVGSYAVFKPAQHPEVAAKWLAYVTNPENTLTIIKTSGFISPRASITPDEYAEGVFADIAAQAQYMRSEPKHIKAREVMAAQMPEFEAAYLGSKSVQDALRDSAAAARRIMAE